LTLSIKEIGWR